MASSEIEDFNWNLRHFLDVMANYQANINKANPTTIQLLEQTVDKLGDLLGSVDEIEDSRNESIIFSIDDTKFDVKRSIYCRMCEVQFGATRTEYILHSANDEHNRKLIEYMNKNDTNNNKNVESGKSLSVSRKTSSIDSDKVPTSYQLDNALKNDENAHTNGTAAIDRERKLSNTSKQQLILNVFEDDFFEFLNSREHSGNATEQLNKTNAKSELNFESEKPKAVETGAIPKNGSWRSGSNGNVQAPRRVEQWRQNSNTDQTVNHNAASSKLTNQGQALNTRDIIQNGAIFTGVGIRPCPTYELNNLYLKFPHLNSEKVPNPLKPSQSHKTRLNGTTTAQNSSTVQMQNPNKTNRERRTISRERNQTPPSSSSSATNKNSLANRGRSASSIDILGTSTQRKNDHKPPAQQKNQSKDDKSNGGAIPRQPNKLAVLLDNSKSFTRLYPIEVPNNPIDTEKLKKLFSNDLSPLINLIVTVNSRPEKIAAQEKLIESVETSLKKKFPTVKGYLIGSHAYKIAKGGLATVDIHLDIRNSFNADKSSQVFIEGMNELVKLLQTNEEWSNVDCLGISRYDILSADHMGANSEKKKCHFTFGTGVAVKNTEIINSMFAAQPVAKQVVICIRLALQEGSKDEWTTHFSGYVITLMVIFYLQIEKKLPSVLSLQEDATPLIKCGENLVHFKNPTVTICKDRIRDLLIGFFNYYQNFDFTNNIISTFEGSEIHKDFRNENSNALSPSMRRFKNLIATESKRWIQNHMCIQDTFEHKRNVTYKVEGNHVKAFKDFCAKSLAIIQAIGPSVKY